MMRTFLLCCLIASALSMSPYWSQLEEQEDIKYICPEDASEILHLSYCAWDPCQALANPHPCVNEPEAYCKYNACANVHCDLQFFVGNRWVNCTLDESAFLAF